MSQQLPQQPVVQQLAAGSVVGVVPRLALSRAEAAASIGVSVDFLEEHVLGDLRLVRRGRRRLIPVSELQRWLEKNASSIREDLA